MKIVIDGRMILPQMSGVGRYLLGLCQGLQRIRETAEIEYEVWIQSELPKDHPVWSFNRDQLLIKAMSMHHMNWKAHARFPIEMMRCKSDLLHFPHFDLPVATPGRIVSTIHDLKYITHPEYFSHKRYSKRLLIQMLTNFTCQRSQYVICDSQATAIDLTRLLRVPPQKLRVVPLGVDERFYRKYPDLELKSWRERNSLDFSFLLFVGERRPHKNIPGLIQSFQILRKKTNVPYQLVIAGKRYADYRLPEETVKMLELENEVRFLDYIPDSELPYLYQSAEVVLLLSNYEGFGLPVLEAMASGTPVIAANTSALPEVVGSAGLLVHPDRPDQAADALLQVIKGGSSRETCIAAGFQRAQSFTWENCARQTRSVYLEALSP